jgi:hypothetical protein
MGSDWGSQWLSAREKLTTILGREPDFMIPALSKDKDGSFNILPHAMPYQQFRTMTALFYQQAPACLSAEAARRISGHSGRRFHSTLAARRGSSPEEKCALANWIGVPGMQVASNMPLRYNGTRDLTELGIKMENILAAKYVLSETPDGTNLTWASFSYTLQKMKVDVREETSQLIAATENPTGNEKEPNIYVVRSSIPKGEKRLKKEKEEVDKVVDSSGSGSGSDAASSTSESEAGAETLPPSSSPKKRKVELPTEVVPDPAEMDSLDTLTDYVGTRSLVAHPVRATVHITENHVKTVCGEVMSTWPNVIEITPPEAVRGWWPMCSRPRCFGTLPILGHQTATSRKKSGRLT